MVPGAVVGGGCCKRRQAWQAVLTTGYLASGPWVAVEAAERGDEADEARGVARRNMVLGAFRDWVRIVRGGAGARASQLIASVRRT